MHSTYCRKYTEDGGPQSSWEESVGGKAFKEWGGVFKMVGGGDSGENSGRRREFCPKRPKKVFQNEWSQTLMRGTM